MADKPCVLEETHFLRTEASKDVMHVKWLYSVVHFSYLNVVRIGGARNIFYFVFQLRERERERETEVYILTVYTYMYIFIFAMLMHCILSCWHGLHNMLLYFIYVMWVIQQKLSCFIHLHLVCYNYILHISLHRFVFLNTLMLVFTLSK